MALFRCEMLSVFVPCFPIFPASISHPEREGNGSFSFSTAIFTVSITSNKLILLLIACPTSIKQEQIQVKA